MLILVVYALLLHHHNDHVVSMSIVHILKIMRIGFKIIMKPVTINESAFMGFEVDKPDKVIPP